MDGRRRGLGIPEDAAGRVEFIAVQVPSGGERVVYDEVAPITPEPRGPLLPDGAVQRALRSFTAAGAAGWLPVTVLGVVLLLVFLAGLYFAR